MQTNEALILVISEMGIGPSFVLPTKADIKEAIYARTGHYPRQAEFDRCLEALLKSNNTFNFGYETGWGWYRADNPYHFKNKYNRIINSNQQKSNALTV